MANKHDSIGRTFAVVGGLCLICSILVAGSAVGLRPWQEAAKARDRQSNILSVAQLPLKNIRQTYQQRINARLIDLATGEFAAGDADTYDMVRAAKEPARSIAIPKESDVAGIRRRAKLAPVYFVKNAQGQTETLILPVYGQGLWSTMYGFIALQPDGNTVKGITFYEHGETPGLGSEIQNPRWQALWTGKQFYNADGQFELKIIKGSADPADRHKVDGISGSTLTSNGVEHLFAYWMGQHGYGAFLSKLRSGELKYE